MLAFTNVVDFFTHELACLRAGRFALAFVPFRAFQSFFVWHESLLVKSDAGVQERGLLFVLPRCWTAGNVLEWYLRRYARQNSTAAGPVIILAA
jgi:hypothetical protein